MQNFVRTLMENVRWENVIPLIVYLWESSDWIINYVTFRITYNVTHRWLWFSFYPSENIFCDLFVSGAVSHLLFPHKDASFFVFFPYASEFIMDYFWTSRRESQFIWKSGFHHANQGVWEIILMTLFCKLKVFSKSACLTAALASLILSSAMELKAFVSHLELWVTHFLHNPDQGKWFSVWILEENPLFLARSKFGTG